MAKYDFIEMDKLEEYLKEHGFDYKRKPLHDGQQIVVNDERGIYSWDVILHRWSYGCEKNLMEAAGEDLLGHDDVEGYLSAEDVINMIEGFDS